MVWPEPKSSAAGTRMMQLIDLFLEQNFEITFASAAQESDFSFDLKSLPIKKVKIYLNDSSFDEFARQLNPKYVLFDRFITEEQFGWRVQDNCPNALRILDTEDLHCLRLARQKAVKSDTPFTFDLLLTEEVAKREISSIYRCDISLIISDFEMELLQNVFKIDSSLLYYLPLFYSVNQLQLSFDEKKDFIFIGNFLHEPNWDAVKELKQKIWKSIKSKIPEAKLHIYGAYPSQKVMQLHNEKEGFIVHGRAEDSLKVINQARVLLAPLRFGAGIKGKLLEAMTTGTPTVTSEIGAEGISENVNWNGFVTNEIEDFIKYSIELYSIKEIWENKNAKGSTILHQKFLKKIYEKSFFEHLYRISENISHHRKVNFLGTLLQTQQYLATKYLSKWIEEKNK
jgi:O-antigen biosynthesis protein